MKIDVDTDFPAFAKQARIDLGMTQAECAARGGIDAACWSRMERGRYTQMTWDMGLRVLRGLRYSLEFTYQGPELPDKPEQLEIDA